MSFSLALGQDEETLGIEAQKLGDYRMAIQHFTTALQSTPEGSVAEEKLQIEILSIVPKLDPVPALPREAEADLIKGESVILVANKAKPQEFAGAVTDLKQFLRLAPWYADGYYLLSQAEEGVQDNAGAIKNLKLYLLTHPPGSDAISARKHLGELQEQYLKAQEEAFWKEKEEQSKKRQAAMDVFLGEWNESFSYKYTAFLVGKSTAVGSGKFTFTKKTAYTIEGYEKDLYVNFSFHSGNFKEPTLVLRGTFENSQSSELTWMVFPLNENVHDQRLPHSNPEGCPDLGTHGWPIQLDVSPEGSSIQFSYAFEDLQKCFPKDHLENDSVNWTLTR